MGRRLAPRTIVYSLQALAITFMFMVIVYLLKPQPQLKPSPAIVEPAQMFFLDDMIVFQKFTGDRAMGFSVLTDPDDIGWTCYVNKPLHIAHCASTIHAPDI